MYSNTPDKDFGLSAPAGSHICLDLGEQEYTKGRPHRSIDPQERMELLREQGASLDVAAIIDDVVLGYGAHDDPVAELAPVCAEITAAGEPVIVTYMLGMAGDLQGLDTQHRHSPTPDAWSSRPSPGPRWPLWQSPAAILS